MDSAIGIGLDAGALIEHGKSGNDSVNLQKSAEPATEEQLQQCHLWETALDSLTGADKNQNNVILVNCALVACSANITVV